MYYVLHIVLYFLYTIYNTLYILYTIYIIYYIYYTIYTGAPQAKKILGLSAEYKKSTRYPE